MYLYSTPVETWTSLLLGEDLLSFGKLVTLYNKPLTDFEDAQVRCGVFLNMMAISQYSSALTDLGQSQPSNIFASPQLTLDFANSTVSMMVKAMNRSTPLEWEGMLETRVPAKAEEIPLNDITAFYKWAKKGVPHVDPAVLSTEYLCQVAKLKSTGSLIISIVVADLVLLQTLWVAFDWAVSSFHHRGQPEARYCLGCLKQMGLEDSDDDSDVWSIKANRTSYEHLSDDQGDDDSASTVVQRSSASTRSVSSLRKRSDNGISVRTSSLSSVSSRGQD